MKYFVILRHPNGKPIPMVSIDEFDCENLALYDSEEEAETAAENNSLGAAYGYEVYEWVS